MRKSPKKSKKSPKKCLTRTFGCGKIRDSSTARYTTTKGRLLAELSSF